MPPRIRLPPGLRGRAFAVGEAAAFGMQPQRLRGSDLERPFWGVRAPIGTTATLHARCLALATRMPHGQFFSHLTAAELWGIPLRPSPRSHGTVDVAVAPGTVIPAGAGVAGHRLQVDREDVVILGGLRVTSQARTWCDLAAGLSEEDLVAAGDYLLWHRRPAEARVQRRDLAEGLDRFTGRRGRPRLVRALPFLTDRSDSRPESVIRWRLADAGLPRAIPNLKLFDGSGNFLAMPDLCYSEYRLALDYEGDHHRTDSLQWEKDIARVPRLEDAAWKHLRVSKADLRDSRELIQRVSTRLRDAGWRG